MSENANGAEVRELAATLRMVLDEIEAGTLGCSAAFRHRIEGAVLVLETMTGAASAPSS